MKDLILKWANERGLLVQGNERNQLIKLYEEAGELSSAILKDKPEEVKDALGDIQVVLIILANQLGYDLDECLKDAYNVIKDRQGKKVNGIFIKD
jgi:NTP pyrophosphatase (non-canonical NTP hydrolase)